MAYNKKNKMLRIKLVNEIVQHHYIEGVTTYKGIYEKYVKHIYPMCYETFLDYINTVVPKVVEQPVKTQFQLFETDKNETPE